MDVVEIVEEEDDEEDKECEDWCFVCKDGGSLMLCEFKDCPKVYHESCLGKDSPASKIGDSLICSKCSGKCQIIHWRQGHKDECRPASIIYDNEDEKSDSDLSSIEENEQSPADETVLVHPEPVYMPSKEAIFSNPAKSPEDGNGDIADNKDDLIDKEEAVLLRKHLDPRFLVSPPPLVMTLVMRFLLVVGASVHLILRDQNLHLMLVFLQSQRRPVSILLVMLHPNRCLLICAFGEYH